MIRFFNNLCTIPGGILGYLWIRFITTKATNKGDYMPKQVLPIKPKDIARQKSKNIPSAVIEAFNELIAKDFDGESARVLQAEAVKQIVGKGIKKGDIFANGWLDVEEIFEKKGWVVEYDKPAYCESYEPVFIFTAK
jgi:hypothetical protein